LDFDDQLGPCQLCFQAPGLALQPSIFDGLWIGPAAPLCGHQTLQFAAGALAPPGAQMRQVQAFPA
jgi:hypothetical protein